MATTTTSDSHRSWNRTLQTRGTMITMPIPDVAEPVASMSVSTDDT
jgi:hypothetical protein